MSTTMILRAPVPVEFKRLGTNAYRNLMASIAGYVVKDVEACFGTTIAVFENVVVIADRTEFLIHWTYNDNPMQSQRFTDFALSRWRHHCQAAIDEGQRDGELRQLRPWWKFW